MEPIDDSRTHSRQLTRGLAWLLSTECPATPLGIVRDRALLLNGFWTAARPSNLSALNWRDVTDHGVDGLSQTLRRSKTDQVDRGLSRCSSRSPGSARSSCGRTAGWSGSAATRSTTSPAG